jgi:hypothetical protein
MKSCLWFILEAAYFFIGCIKGIVDFEQMLIAEDSAETPKESRVV